jgi:A/G-specific adenine glycosylase
VVGRAEDEGRDTDAAWVAGVRDALGAWYDAGHRDLPWRREPRPYRVLVSEMMLVQTTVAAAVPYFERFLARFPTVEALAGADEAEVLRVWEGLGYYRRARQLQAAARAIVAEHGGRVPDDPEAMRALPGVGRYIAGAVLSIAYDRPEPILEANSRRVLARWLGWEGPPGAATDARLWRAAERLVPPVGAGRFNQALMELGATVCAPRQPRCLACPVAPWCQARARGTQDAVPATASRPGPQEVAEACVVVASAGRVLLVRRAVGGLWAGFWEFPTLHRDGPDPARRRFEDDPIDLAEGLERLTGVAVEVEDGPAHAIRFGVTRYRVGLTAYRGRVARPVPGTPRPGPGLDAAEWVAVDDLGRHPLGAAQRRLAVWFERRGWDGPKDHRP